MLIKNIDLEKMEFLSDIERNIFVLPRKNLKDFHIEEETNVVEAEEKDIDYEHKTVFLFNGRKMYEVPCRLAAKNVLSKKARDYFTNYIYYRKWADIKPEEIDMISLFLYNFIKEKKEESNDVEAYEAKIGAKAKAWAHTGQGTKGTRKSNQSRQKEMEKTKASQKELSTRIQKPVDTVVKDRASISEDAKGETGRKKDNGFFDNFGSMLQGLSDFAGVGDERSSPSTKNREGTSNTSNTSASIGGSVGDFAYDLVETGVDLLVMGGATLGGAEVGFWATGGNPIGALGGAAVGLYTGYEMTVDESWLRQSYGIDGIFTQNNSPDTYYYGR